MAKKIITACGSGVATSSTIAKKVERLLAQKGVKNPVEAINISDLGRRVKDADIYICIAPAKQEDFPIPVINGMAFLTGIGQDKELQKLIDLIKK